MKINRKILYVFIAFLLFFLMLAIVGGNTSTPQQSEPQTIEQQVPSQPSNNISDKGMRKEMKTNFIEGCNAEGANRQFCECTWDYLIENYGLDWLMDKSINTYKTGNIPSEVFDAGKACTQYLNVSQQIN